MKVKYIKSSMFLLMIGLVTFSSCEKTDGEGPVVTQSLDINTFNGIEMPGAENVSIVYGTEQKVLAIGNQNIIDNINRSVSSGVWKMSLQSGNYSDYELRYEITTPNLSSIEVSGSGNVVAHDLTKEYNFRVDVSGSGTVQLDNIHAQNSLWVNLSGSGNLESVGTSSYFNDLSVSCSGSGNYNGFSIWTNNANVNISGSGNSRLSVHNNLFVTLSGSGDVYYRGYPSTSTNITGSGQVINSN